MILKCHCHSIFAMKSNSEVPHILLWWRLYVEYWESRTGLCSVDKMQWKLPSICLFITGTNRYGRGMDLPYIFFPLDSQINLIYLPSGNRLRGNKQADSWKQTTENGGRRPCVLFCGTLLPGQFKRWLLVTKPHSANQNKGRGSLVPRIMLQLTPHILRPFSLIHRHAHITVEFKDTLMHTVQTGIQLQNGFE